jgi:DNA-binding transcriptional LysR family regulator
MSLADDPLSDLRLADVATFLAVCRYGSLTSAARAIRVTPSQVSKSIVRLERQLNITLLMRNSRGVLLSEAAQRALPHLEAMMARVRALRRDDAEQPQGVVTVAAPSYLLGRVVTGLAEALPTWRFRGLLSSPANVRASVTKNMFDVAVAMGDETGSESWIAEPVGDLRLGLFARADTAQLLEPFPASVERVREVPFISPLQRVHGDLVPAEDDCPLPHGRRKLGHEVETFAVGLELASRTDQLVFGPVIAASEYLDRGELVEIPVKDWDVREALCAFINQDRVNVQVSKALLKLVRELLA